MTELVYEGTWEEISRRAPELAKRRLRVTVLAEEPSDAKGTSPSLEAGPSLAEAFAGRVGRLDFGPSDLSERTGEAFTDIIEEKHREGRL